jgi:hypothetical protein
MLIEAAKFQTCIEHASVIDGVWLVFAAAAEVTWSGGDAAEDMSNGWKSRLTLGQDREPHHVDCHRIL